MQSENIYCVIMAGGVGSRFWPLSTEEKPKQFLDVLGLGKTFIRQTYERFADIVPVANFIVMTNFAYKELVLQQLPELDASQVLCEPARRNTAPCIAYAAYHIHAINPDGVMVVTPSDHLVLDSLTFQKVIHTTLSFVAENDALMTIGIKPSRPETGYGYIQTLSQLSLGEISKVKTFTEKPNLELAKVFVESGEFLWNSGIFMWSCGSILKAIKSYLSDVDAVFSEGEFLFGTPEESTFINKAFPTCVSISIDYGIMEKADNVYVCSADFGWSDIGTWGSLYEYSNKDKHHNSIVGENVVCKNVSNSIVRVGEGKTAIIDGVDNHIVVFEDDKLLICSKDREQSIKSYLDEINRP